MTANPSTKRSVRRRGARWPDYLLARLHRLRQRMAEQMLDALVVTRDLDIHYLTSFPGEDATLILTGRSAVVLSDFRFAEELARHYPWLRAKMCRHHKAKEIARIADAGRWKRLGIQADAMTVAGRKALAKHVGAGRLKEIDGWLLDQRSVKDAVEVRILRNAVRIQEGAFRKLLTQIKPGMTERQITAQLEFNMRVAGGDGPAFKTIVGSGPNSSKPHYRPGSRKLRRNEPLLIDFGCLMDGYHSDMTRVVFFGKPSRKVAEVYGVVREAMQAGIEACGPGVELVDVFKASNRVIKAAGYEKNFRHGLGHGIGLQIHERPNIGGKSKGQLKPGHVVTIEPGIYLSGVGGVRLEDDILITGSGRRNLCSLPTDLESAII